MNRSSCHRPPVPGRRARQRGAVAIVVGLMMAVLVGFIGLALDGGHLYLTKTELQNSADACALAASYELTGAPSIAPASFARAEAAGQAVGQMNKVDFQNSAIASSDIVVSFGTDLSAGNAAIKWVNAGAALPSSKYVRCTITRSNIMPWFMQVLMPSLDTLTVSSLATATLAPAQNNCGIPMAICSKGSAPSYGMTPGQWVSGFFGAGGGVTGSFNWIDFTPPAGGTSELAALLTGNGVCTLNVPTPVGEPGALGAAAAKAWNTRFGLYQTGSTNVTTAPPDFTGYSYTPTNWPSKANALADFLSRRSAHASYGATVSVGNTITGLGINNSYNPTTTVAQHTLYGADRRLVTAPIVDCGGWVASNTVPIQSWACVLMLHPIDAVGDVVYMEYEGLSSASGSPCATSGVAGDLNSVGPMVPALVQ
ncbi:conserved hypothetical protein [Rhodoferax ferrireducens T118]|uniref:Putative Flp pilus-assembly TadG-like N-terminal domain-containing protein n=1 Tax=Albidiferax ferrireducens (strain ATCC BAA-621 / DSM 15236 / T118) TaxID=338969 RepID=Q220K8_ALBFT|nr:Tad domain-containing protein [Rhodoferax ferrireducens]ABD68545.1 conserved hypothetical protein [Rhodoferax ferrireducens T118]